MSKAIAAMAGLCALALVVEAHAQARQGGRAPGAPPAEQSAPTPSPTAQPPGAPGGSTQRGRSMSVGEAEAQLREAEQQPGPPARNLTRPLIQLGWAPSPPWRASPPSVAPRACAARCWR